MCRQDSAIYLPLGAAEHMRRTAQQAEPNAAVLTIRLPVELRDEIDAALAKRPINMPGNTWVLAALLEKLARNGQKGGGHGTR